MVATVHIQIPVIQVQPKQVEEKLFQSRVAEYVQAVVREAVRIAMETDHSEGSGCSQPQRLNIPASEVKSESPTPPPESVSKETSKPCSWKGKRVVMPRKLGAMRTRHLTSPW